MATLIKNGTIIDGSGAAGYKGSVLFDRQSITSVTKGAETPADADLVIEAVPEDLALKRKIFRKMDELAPQRAIFATNSSSIPISKR